MASSLLRNLPVSKGVILMVKIVLKSLVKAPLQSHLGVERMVLA